MSVSYKAKICIGYVLAIFLTWVIITFEYRGHLGNFKFIKYLGNLVGIIGYTFFSLSLLLSSRWRYLENWFGGLDQIYHLHRQIGLWGFCFILAHPLILTYKKTTDQFIYYLLPFHPRTSINLGVYAFWLMLILLGITILKILPYDRWKISHKWMSLVFLLASFHFLLSDRLIGPSSQSKLLMSIPFGIGLLSISYKQLLFYFKKTYKYQVTKIKPANYNTIEIFLEPKGDQIPFISGQYAFFTFQGSLISRESHPFTLCGKQDGSKNSILVKKRGDFTNSLFDHIKLGDFAYIEGPHGRFDFRNQGNLQIWIAGGIGIVPFLCWSRMLEQNQTNERIDLFYCVHEKKDMVYFNEFTDISNKTKKFRFFPIFTAQEGHLNARTVEKTVGSLKNHTILMCGPKKMTRELRHQFLKIGINDKRIIFEDFEFL